jgi:hypothetical protein
MPRRKAFEVEKEALLATREKGLQWDGDPFLASGNTELFYSALDHDKYLADMIESRMGGVMIPIQEDRPGMDLRVMQDLVDIQCELSQERQKRADLIYSLLSSWPMGEEFMCGMSRKNLRIDLAKLLEQIEDHELE